MVAVDSGELPNEDFSTVVLPTSPMAVLTLKKKDPSRKF
jgi:hypothetical protein